MAAESVRPFHPYNSTDTFLGDVDRGRTLAPVNCTRIEKVYLNSRLLTEPAHPRISPGRPINYAFSRCSRNERSNVGFRSRLPARCFSSSSQISTRPAMGEKDEKNEEIEREEEEKGQGKKKRKKRKNLSKRVPSSLAPSSVLLPPPLVALKQWAYISWAAHACEIVLIYRWAITRSHILGSRLHVGLAAQLSCRRETKRSRRKGEKIGGGRWDQPRFERGGGGGVGGLLPRDSRAEFISIRGGACSDNASVAFHPSSSDTHPFNFDFSLIETSSNFRIQRFSARFERFFSRNFLEKK